MKARLRMKRSSNYGSNLQRLVIIFVALVSIAYPTLVIPAPSVSPINAKPFGSKEDPDEERDSDADSLSSELSEDTVWKVFDEEGFTEHEDYEDLELPSGVRRGFDCHMYTMFINGLIDSNDFNRESYISSNINDVFTDHFDLIQSVNVPSTGDISDALLQQLLGSAAPGDVFTLSGLTRPDLNSNAQGILHSGLINDHQGDLWMTSKFSTDQGLYSTVPIATINQYNTNKQLRQLGIYRIKKGKLKRKLFLNRPDKLSLSDSCSPNKKSRRGGDDPDDPGFGGGPPMGFSGFGLNPISR